MNYSNICKRCNQDINRKIICSKHIKLNKHYQNFNTIIFKNIKIIDNYFDYLKSIFA